MDSEVTYPDGEENEGLTEYTYMITASDYSSIILSGGSVTIGYNASGSADEDAEISAG